MHKDFHFIKKNLILVVSLAVAIAIVLIVISKLTETTDGITEQFVSPEIGRFEIVVTSTGELEAENSVEIHGPSTDNRRIRVNDLTITDLVEEGTEVKAGDYIATLDKTTVENTYKDAEETLETRLESYEMTLLDSAVTLSNSRGSIQNLLFSIEAAQIKLDQSTYESPATVRDAQKSVEKAERDYQAAKLQYELTYKKQLRNIANAKERYDTQKQLVEDYAKMLEQFTVYAPKDGMVIYYKDFFDQKREVGSSIDNFDNVVALLPDMTQMISKTYVNEIDVNKIKQGQTVMLDVDALPGETYTGKVISAANVGEQLPNADAKVFEVLIRLDGYDPQLRPSMTTGNRILTNGMDDVMYLPLACVQTDEEGITFVYLKNGTRQIVVTGESNDNHIIIEQGLKKNANVYLVAPENTNRFRKISGEELISVIKARKSNAGMNTAQL